MIKNVLDFFILFFVFSVSTGRHEQNKQKINIIGQLQPNLKKRSPAQKIYNPRFEPKKGDTTAHVEHISPFQKRSILLVKVDFDIC